MVDRDFLDCMKKGAVFFNSSRGKIVDEQALLQMIDSGHITSTCLDVWQNEPAINESLFNKVSIATPHIAGYSFDGKVTGTSMIYEAACSALGILPSWKAKLPEPIIKHIYVKRNKRTLSECLFEAVSKIYHIMDDDKRLRTTRESETLAERFTGLRKEYPVRREFRFTEAYSDDPEVCNALKELGFSLNADIYKN